ncbi:hypothetical protein KSC_058040 [Ktedonobacter sp. SOSP1-52]|nr:hypothetical protein KSC_058040 [Ktedonobacter sp. SOSP1-52]
MNTVFPFPPPDEPTALYVQSQESTRGKRQFMLPPRNKKAAMQVDESVREQQRPHNEVEASETHRIPSVTIELINTLRLPKASNAFSHREQKRRSVKPAHHQVAPQTPRVFEETHLQQVGRKYVSYTTAIMNTQQKRIYLLLIGIWLCSLVFFWTWWLRPEHVVTPFGMILNSLVLLWSTLLPGYYFFFVSRMRQPDMSLPVPPGKIAMVVTKAPSEPWSVVEKTLAAMKAQTFPRTFDVWLADEDPSEEIVAWCIAHGIWISCRKNMPGYQNTIWPRRQKSKEGNLSYFYDTCGYRLYDFVVQLDADHVPEPTYLLNMITPFGDPAIGYVAAPSICDANAASSWPARARLYAEGGLHGAMQAGYSNGFAPLCIGSHYAVRTQALKDIGGLGPELAEDHSTTFLFNAYGWRGAFAFNAFAHGDGAECLADSVTQEFQWSRSLTKLLLTLTPRHWNNLPLKLRAQFLFAQLWYPLSCINMLLICLLPLLALAIQTPLANVNYLDFLLHFTGTTASCLLIVFWIQYQGWFRPINAKVLSWETWLFPMICWPWTLMGVLHAIVSTLLKRELSFRVTPKGRNQIKPLPNRVLLPYTLIVLLTCLCALMLPGGKGHTYQWFATVNIFFYTALIWISIIGHIHDNRYYGLGATVFAIKGSLWQGFCVTLCLLIDLQIHASEIGNLFVPR